MIRPRKKGYQDLPPNLYWHKTLGRFYYKHPINKKITYLDRDRDTAINTANICNAQLMQRLDKADVILGNTMSMSKWCEHFENVILPTKKLAASTVKGHKVQLRHIKSHFKDADIGTLTVRDISEYLDKKPPVLSNRVRSLMIILFKHAIAKGYCSENLAKNTMPVETIKQRKRLSIEQYNAILNFKKEIDGKIVETPKWLKVAMRLAFVTTQRVNEVAKMRYDDMVDGHFRVQQKKTGVKIAIKLFPELSEVIKESKDDLLSPYIVHKDPIKNISFKGRGHYTQCSSEYISKAFSEIRDLIPEFKAMPMSARPSFHEIRATAIKWYEDQGIDVQFLAGHASRKMTEHYKKGHDDWMIVKVS